MSDLILEQMQADAFGILRACPGLVDAEIVSANDGDVEAEVLRKLAPLTGARRGLAIVVMLPELTGSEENLPGPTSDAILEIQVIESVLVNRGSGGTGIRATTAALRVLGALHHLRVGNASLFSKRNPMEPLPGKKGIVTYVVRLNAESVGADPVEKVAEVTVGMDGGGDIELVCATAEAAVYYTLDGTFPGAGNAAAILYSEPFTMEVSGTVRAAAFLPPLNPSGITEERISI